MREEAEMERKCGAATEGGEVGLGRARRGGDRAELVGVAKRRKLDDGGGSIGILSTKMELPNRRILPRTSVFRRKVGLGCGSENPSSGRESGVSSLSSCYGDESSGSRSDVHGFVDLEADRSNDTATSEYGSRAALFSELRDEGARELMQNSSSTLKSVDAEDSSAKISDSECCCCSGGRRTSSTEEENEKTAAPTKVEIEEFFSAAEKQHREKFAEKYNFDFLKEKPLEGRYEWVKL